MRRVAILMTGRVQLLAALLLLAAGCPPSPPTKEQRCAERGYESTYGRSLGTVCVERRADGMGVLLLLPDETAEEGRR